MQHNIDFLKLVEEYRPSVKELSTTEVKTKVEHDNHLAIVDVREDYEWNQGHIPHAIHLSRGILERDIEKTIPDKNTPIIIYCSGGFRSVLAAYNLQKMGYSEVYSMENGLREWINLGYNIVL
jgi:rhodanese-related sulfurtransferase